MIIENLSNPGIAPIDGDRVRITHDNGAVEEKEYCAPPAVVAKPKLVVTGITSITPSAISVDFSDVTCPVNTVLTVAAELRGASGILPVTATFRMPIRARDGREKVLLASLVNGVAQINAPMRSSGVWQVTEAMINAALPQEQQMAFAGITIYVTEE